MVNVETPIHSRPLLLTRAIVNVDIIVRVNELYGKRRARLVVGIGRKQMTARYFATASALAFTAHAIPTYAQDTNDIAQPSTGPAVASEEVIEDVSPSAEAARSSNTIIVTATRREESIQDVPLSDSQK